MDKSSNFQSMYESTIEGFLLADTNLKITAFNALATKFVMNSTTALPLQIGENLLTYVQSDRRSFVNEVIDKVKGGKVIKYERCFEATDSNNNIKWIQYTYLPYKKDGEILGIVLLGENITEKKVSEEKLHMSEQLYRTLIHECSDLVHVIDVDGNYKYLTGSLNSVIGNKAKDFLGKNAFEFVHPADRERLKEEFAGLASVKKAKSSPYRFHCGDYNYRWIETVATNLLDDPAVKGIVVNSHDLTDTINYLQSIEKQNKCLQDIAWMQAHEVRAPLSAILGIVDLFSDDIGRAELTDLIKLLKDSAYKLDKVIRATIKKTESVAPDAGNNSSEYHPPGAKSSEIIDWLGCRIMTPGTSSVN